MNQTLLKKQTKADSFLDFRWLCHWYQGFPCLFIECCFHAYFWCAFSLRRLRLTQGRQDTPSPKYENNIPWTATDIPDINTLHSLSHNLCLRYLDFQKLYNICTIGAHVGRFDLSPPLRPEKGVGGTRALAHSIYIYILFSSGGIAHFLAAPKESKGLCGFLSDDHDPGKIRKKQGNPYVGLARSPSVNLHPPSASQRCVSGSEMLPGSETLVDIWHVDYPLTIRQWKIWPC